MKRGYWGVCLLAVAALAAPAALCQPVVMDDFNVDQICAVLTSPANVTTNQTGAPTSIIGGERALHVNATAIGPGGEVDLNVSGGGLQFLRTSNATAVIEAWLDGTNGSTTIDTVAGLGGVDLTTNGNDRFTVVVTSATNSPVMLLRIYSSATAYSDATFALPNAGGTVNILYSAFTTGAGASSAANFASVRAGNLSTNATTGLAIGNIDSISVTPVELSRFAVE